MRWLQEISLNASSIEAWKNWISKTMREIVNDISKPHYLGS